MKKIFFVLLLFMCAALFTLYLNKYYMVKNYMVKKPNVVLIVVDVLRADHLSCYGYEKETSPTIDNLAAEGVLFTQAISQATITSASVASMMTAKYPHTHGVLDLNSFGFSLDASEMTFAEVLKMNGYATAAFVSSEALHTDLKLDQGFMYYDDKFDEKRTDTSTIKRAIKWLKRNYNNPFFLFIHLFDVHEYNTIPFSYNEFRRYMGQGSAIDFYILEYDRRIRAADSQIKRLLENLDGLKLSKNTIIIITADHGETLKEHFRRLDHGASVYEQEIRIPLIIKYDGLKVKNRKIHNLVASIDIVPTVLDILHIQSPNDIEGISFLPGILDKTAFKRRYVFSESQIWGRDVQRADIEPFVTNIDEYPLGMADKIRCIREDTFKLISVPTRVKTCYELYNLKEDPKELTNLIKQEPEIARRLMGHLSVWMASAKYKIEAHPKKSINEMDEKTRERLRSLGYIQ